MYNLTYFDTYSLMYVTCILKQEGEIKKKQRIKPNPPPPPGGGVMDIWWEFFVSF